MVKRYRVIDCMTPSAVPDEHFCDASTPEEAARLTLGVKLVRGGIPSDLRAKVYYLGFGGVTSMVRLYTQAKHRS